MTMEKKYTEFLNLLQQAQKLDENDPLRNYVNEFSHPSGLADFRGNSLGFMPKHFPLLFANETHKWGNICHDGHTTGKQEEQWWVYGEQYEKPLAELLGCNSEIPEAVIGNSLSINNFLLILFALWKMKQRGKTKVITVSTIFPSDMESIKSALRIVHGKAAVDDLIIQVQPGTDELYDFNLLYKAISQTGSDTALGFFEIINFKTGQRFPVKQLARHLHDTGALIGLDLAHGIGNIQLHMNKWGIDFATFCSYKYLNGGPGGVGGFYVQESLIEELGLVLGWWGLDKDTRFGPSEGYRPARGVRRFLASNDPIFNSLGLKANLEIISQYSFAAIEQKHKDISAYLYDLLSCLPQLKIITPKEWDKRGCQISFKTPTCDPAKVLHFLDEKYHCYIERRGDVLRVAPVAYNTYAEVAIFAEKLHRLLTTVLI